MLPTILLFGLPRSGTTWAAKTIDAHPSIHYLHEPDIAIRNRKLPPVMLNPPVGEQRLTSERYLATLEACTHPRALSIRPFFKKEFRQTFKRFLYRGTCIISNLLYHYSYKIGSPIEINIPRKLVHSHARMPRLLIKSVSCFGRIQMYSTLRPGWHFLHLVRHPCAFAASKLRGAEAGVMALDVSAGAIATISQHQGVALHASTVRDLPAHEQLALFWVVMNGWAWQTLSNRRYYQLVSLESLLSSPLDRVRELYASVDLEAPATMVSQSSRQDHKGRSGFYSLNRDTEQVKSGWKRKFNQKEINQIREIIGHYPFGRMYNSAPENWH